MTCHKNNKAKFTAYKINNDIKKNLKKESKALSNPMYIQGSFNIYIYIYWMTLAYIYIYIYKGHPINNGHFFYWGEIKKGDFFYYRNALKIVSLMKFIANYFIIEMQRNIFYRNTFQFFCIVKMHYHALPTVLLLAVNVTHIIAQSAGTVEYTNCISAEG